MIVKSNQYNLAILKQGGFDNFIAEKIINFMENQCYFNTKHKIVKDIIQLSNTKRIKLQIIRWFAKIVHIIDFYSFYTCLITSDLDNLKYLHTTLLEEEIGKTFIQIYYYLNDAEKENFSGGKWFGLKLWEELGKHKQQYE